MWLETIAVVGAGVVVLAVYFRRRIESKFGTHDITDEEDIRGKVVLITGANTGLGKEAAKEMAKRGATVIMASRNMDLTNEAIADIRKFTSDGELVPFRLDLGSLESVREFANEIKKTYNRIDILINNAGVFCPLKKGLKTSEGFEYNMGINHLGHFLLTNLLLDTVKMAVPSRIVVVASTLSESGKIDFDDLMLEKADPESEGVPGRPGNKLSAYGNSKLANILFSRELATRLSGTGVHTYALCPGWVKTDLGRYMELSLKAKFFMVPAAYMFMRTTHQGVQTILHCALSRKCATETGKLYRNCDIWVTKSKLTDDLAKKLWEKSEALVQLKK